MTTPLFERDLGVQQPPPPPAERVRGPAQREPFRDTAKVVSFFREQEFDRSLLAKAHPVGTTISLNDPANKSLTLAHNNRFFDLCEPILWGSEDRELFGEMLRGLVIEFKPTNTFHLHLLRAIAEPTWQLFRASKYKKGVFENGATTAGLHGLPVGTAQAFEQNKLSEKLLRQLDEAVALYHRTVA